MTIPNPIPNPPPLPLFIELGLAVLFLASLSLAIWDTWRVIRKIWAHRRWMGRSSDR